MPEQILQKFPPLTQKILPVALSTGGHVDSYVQGKHLGQDLQQ